MTERDLDRQIGDALRRRAGAFRPDEARAANQLFGRHDRHRYVWAVGVAAGLLAVAGGASWWMLADDEDALNVVTPDPGPTTSTVPVEDERRGPSGAPALVITPPDTREHLERRGHIALMSGEGPFVEDFGSEWPLALSPDGSLLVIRRSSEDPSGPADLIVRRLADGSEASVDDGTCPRFSADGRLVSIGFDPSTGGTTLMAYDTDLVPLFRFETAETLYCAQWDEGGDRLVAVAFDEQEVHTLRTIDGAGSATEVRIEGLHPESHVALGPAVGRGRFVVLVPSHPPVSWDVDRWELGELIVDAGGSARYERTTELSAVPDWSHPDRTLLGPSAPVPLGRVRVDMDDDGALVFTPGYTPSYLVTDGFTGNLFAIDGTGEVRYLTTGVGQVITPPGGIRDEYLGVPLAWPEWVTRIPAMDASPCDAPVAHADVTGDGRLDRVFHQWIDGTAVLGICTADGVVDSIAGRGQTEIGGAIQLDPAGKAVLIAGGTSVSWGGFDVAVVEDGRIRYVDLDGEPLTLWEGSRGAILDRNETNVGGAYGCEELTGDGVLELVRVEIVRGAEGEPATWEKRGYRIDGAQATQVFADGGTIEPAEVPVDQAATLTQPCPETE